MESADAAFHRLCRCCMMPDQNFHSIYENAKNQLKICEMLATVTPELLIHSSNELPQQLCVTCLKLLNIAYSFHQMCIASEKQLLNICVNRSLISEELPFTATTAINSEENEEPEDVKDIVVEDFAVSAQQLDASKMDADSHFKESCGGNTNSLLRRNDETAHEDDEDEELQRTSRISDLHDEIGVNEIEKTSLLNRRLENLVCLHCSKKFKRVYDCKRHALIHNEKGRCEVLSSKECKGPKRKKIRKRPAPPDGYKCSECPRRFEKGQSLAAHMHTHGSRLQTFVCNLCPKKFRKFATLTKHAQIHSDNQKYECTRCEKTFRLEEHQIKHTATHHELHPHKCEICGSSFNRFSSLYIHKKIHTGERPHKCKECNKSFAFIYLLKRHKLTHTSEKPYKCTFCDRKYATYGTLTRHLFLYKGEKTCPEKFNNKAVLRVHEALRYKQQSAATASSATTDTATAESVDDLIHKAEI